MPNLSSSAEGEPASYWTRVWRKAKSETARSWTVYRTASAIASPILAAIFWALFKNWKSWTFVMQTAAIAVLVFWAMWAIAFFISLIRAPAIIHREQETVISGFQKAAAAEAKRRLVNPCLSISIGDNRHPTSLRMKWSQGGGTISAPVNVIPIRLRMENEGQEAIKVVAFRFFRVGSELDSRRVEHHERVRPGSDTQVDVTWEMLRLLSDSGTQDPDFSAVRRVHELGVILEYMKDSKRLETEAEHIFLRLFSPGSQTLYASVSYERPIEV